LAIGGFMATGKSTVGPLVAQSLDVPYVDLDARIAERSGLTVAEIFRASGEAGFRRLEREALEEVLAREPLVLALGGGTLHQPGLLGLISAVMDIVILSASMQTLKERGGQGRPLWADAERLYAERLPGYLRAGPQVRVDGLSPELIASRVIAATGVGEQRWF
jgi:shikimate kinase